MNGKRAKEFRKLAEAIPELPAKEYKEIQYKRTTSNVVLDMNTGKPALEVVVKITRVLVPHCTRAWYQSMKKAYIKGE
jgi:hypothetical protein